MAEGTNSPPLSLVDPLDNLEAALAELTQSTIPGYTDEVAALNAPGVEQATAELINQALTLTLKDKTQAAMVGKLAILLSAQFRFISQVAKKSADDLKRQKQVMKNLEDQLAGAK